MTAVFRDVLPSDIVVSGCKRLEHGTMVFLRGAGGPVRVQTPALLLDWTVEIKRFRGTTGCELGLTLGDDDSKAQELKQWLQALTAHLKTLAVAGAEDWTGRAITMDALNNGSFTHAVKTQRSNPGVYFKMKVAFADEQIQLPVFAPDMMRLTTDSLVQGARCTVVFDVPHIWISNNGVVTPKIIANKVLCYGTPNEFAPEA